MQTNKNPIKIYIKHIPVHMLILKTHNTKIDTISPTHKFTQIHTIFIHRLTKVFMLSYTSTYMLSPLTTHTVVLFKINIYTG